MSIVHFFSCESFVRLIAFPIYNFSLSQSSSAYNTQLTNYIYKLPILILEATDIVIIRTLCRSAQSPKDK